MLDVLVLGPTVIKVAGEPIRLDRPMERALAVRLALARGSGVSDERLGDDLWGDAETSRLTERLRVLAYRLRRGLGPHADLMRRSPSGYVLQARPVDLLGLETAQSRLYDVRRAGDPAARLAILRQAIDLWRGGSLEDLRAFPFGQVEADRLDALLLGLRVDWFAAQMEQGHKIPAELEQLAAANPLHEPLVGLSALALYRAGRQADALNRLASLRKALSEELGVDPSPANAELELRILRQDPTLEPPQTVVLASRLGPRQSATPFVGRVDDQAWLLERLAAPCLITLTGGPGMGKTRLAREVAMRVEGRRVAWLDLAPVTSPEAMVAGLAAAAGLTDGSGDVVARSIDELAGALLVVDNAEHLIDPLAGLLNVIRRTGRGLSILVTSQRPVRISDEEVRQLGPLGIDAATELFCARSGAPSDADVVAICTAVDRWPLAIELAAGLTRILSVPQLADRIEHQLRLLIGGMRDSAGFRHNSLRAAINWSHSLLDPPAQQVLRRLAVFSGGCTLEAAEQVVAIDPVEVAVLLTDLHDRCLLAIETTDGGARRFRLLESIRDYSLEQLRASGEEEEVRRRHASWCAELAARNEKYGGPDHGQLLRELILEEANLRAAIEWALGNEPAWATRITAPAWWYWWVRGLMGEARDWLRRSLLALDPAPTAERAIALRTIASLTRNSGDLTEARALGNQALAIFRALGNELGCTTTLLGLCITNITLQDYETALSQGRESAEIALALGNDRIRAAAIDATGGALRCLGRMAEAEKVYLMVHDLWIAIDDPRGLAATRSGLAMIARQRGQRQLAREHCLASLRAYHELDLTVGQLDIVELIAGLEVDDGRPAEALRLLTVAARYRQRLGVPLTVPDELASRDEAEAAALDALGHAAPQIIEAADNLPLEPIVVALLR